MGLWGEIKQRRITQIVVAYLAAGWMVLAVVDQVVDREVLPLVFYEVALTLYLFGIAAALIIGWYHGEKGAQKAPVPEVVALCAVAVACLGVSSQVIRSALSQVADADAFADSGLDLRSIAVLYFEDLSADGELVPVADGITEALIDQLDAVRSLDVVSKNGVLAYRSADLRSDSIARALGVGTLIEGSVDSRGDELRITTRLVDGLSGVDIERALVEIPSGEFLVARDSVAESVSRLLRQRLGEEVQLRELRAGTASAEAWALAQRAERLRTDAEDNFDDGGEITFSVEAYQQADEMLARAQAIDPQWTRPRWARAQAAYRLAWFAWAAGDPQTSREQIANGISHADGALALDPRDANALEQRGTLKMLDLQIAMMFNELDASGFGEMVAEVRGDLEAAVQEDPSLATAHAMMSFLLEGAGDQIGAVLSGRRALEEDAYLRGADRIYDRLYWAQYQLGQLRDSGTWCEQGRQRFPDSWRFTECQLWLMATPSESPDVDRAWELLAQLDGQLPESIRRYRHDIGMILVGGVLMNAGLPDSASSVFARVDHSEEIDPQRNLFRYEAAIRASTGDPDGALDALRRWVAATPGGTLGPEGDLHWWWRPIRDRAEFQQFVDRPN